MSDLCRELAKGAATIINEKQQLILMMSEEIKKLNAENEKLRAQLEALKKYEREKWTGWAAELKGDGDE